MSSAILTEIEFTGNEDLRSLGLVDRALNGEVFVIHKALQQFDLMIELVEASLEGVRRIAGNEIAGGLKWKVSTTFTSGSQPQASLR